MRIGEEIRRALAGKYGRVLVEEDVEGAAVYLPEKDIVICIGRGRHAYYAKVARLSETGGCGAAYYHPRGLYAFADTPEKLIDKLIPKIQRVIGAQQ